MKEGQAIRNKEGKVVKAASFQSREVPKAVIEPNRKWFTNTRVISQDTLTAFRDAVAEKEKDPYSVLLKSNKLPMSLIRDDGPKLQDGLKKHQAKMTIESAPFSETFGPKAQRKRPKLSFNTVDELAGHTENSFDAYQARLEEIKLLSGAAGHSSLDGEGLEPQADFSVSTAKEAIFTKGQSKRIWNELCKSRLLPPAASISLLTFIADKVIDSSDVILHVLDARDPDGTRCRHVEKYLSTEAPHKHLIFVLNKIDLVPSSTAVSHSVCLDGAFAILFYFLHLVILLQKSPQGLVRTLPHFRCILLQWASSVTSLGDQYPSPTFPAWSSGRELTSSVLELGRRIPDVFLLS